MWGKFIRVGVENIQYGEARLTWLDVCSFSTLMTKALKGLAQNHLSNPILEPVPSWTVDSDWGGVYVLGRRKLGRRYTHTPHTSIYRVLPSPLRFKLLLSAVQAS